MSLLRKTSPTKGERRTLTAERRSSCVAAMPDHGLPVIVNRDDARFRGIPRTGPVSELLIPVDRNFLVRVQSAGRRSPQSRFPSWWSSFSTMLAPDNLLCSIFRATSERRRTQESSRYVDRGKPPGRISNIERRVYIFCNVLIPTARTVKNC
jgi:hypothetical protein